MKDSIRSTLDNAIGCAEREDPVGLLICIFTKDGCTVMFRNRDLDPFLHTAMAADIFGAAIVERQQARLEATVPAPPPAAVN